MLSSSQSTRTRVDEMARRLPSFVLETSNLDNYRPWLRRAREWARKQCGSIMEEHLIGQIVPELDLTDDAIAAADVQVTGYPADEGVGAEGGRQRQVRNPESVPEAEREQVVTSPNNPNAY